jgi:hypothetical protein
VSFTATHGQLKPLLNGADLPMSCSSQALDQNGQTQVPPAGLAPSMALGPRPR